jgi:CDP-glycerol glycerophosphotransferase (TagB/SpsB family)
MGDPFPERLRNQPDLLVDVPGRPGKYKDRDPGLEDMKHLAATMWHSAVVLNSSSTVSIDAAAFDTPVVCVGFDGYRTLPEDKSVRRWHKYTHYRKLLALGGVRVGHSLDEVIGHINAYLEDPSLDREGRARIVSRQCLALDGRSAERIGKYLLRAADELRRSR